MIVTLISPEGFSNGEVRRLEEKPGKVWFIRRVSKFGRYYAITIPREYIEQGLIDHGQKYVVILKPVEEAIKVEVKKG